MDFTGCPYPIVKSTRGFFRPQRGVSQVKSDLLALLLTVPGERVMLPTFGTPLNQLVFEQQGDSITLVAKQMISDAIRNWEPRLTITSIDVEVPTASNPYGQTQRDISAGHTLVITIGFVDPSDITSVQALTLEVPLSA